MNTKNTPYRANIDCRSGRYDVALWAPGEGRPGTNDLRATTDDEALAELDAMAKSYGWNIVNVFLVHRAWKKVR